MHVHEFVDEGLGHSSYVIDLGDGTAAVVDPPRFPTEHEALTNEYAAGHLLGAANIELGSVPTAPLATGESVTVMCGHGERAMSAASLLIARKVGARVFHGGPDTWTAGTGQALDVGR